MKMNTTAHCITGNPAASAPPAAAGEAPAAAGPVQAQLRARHLAARERLRAATPPAPQHNDVRADLSALRCELAALRALLVANGVLGKREVAAPVRDIGALIRTAVAKLYRIRVANLDGRRRLASRPRHVAMYLCKTLTRRSLSEIGRRFGGRSHTAVLHAVRKIEKLRRSDPSLDGELRALERRMTRALAEAGATNHSTGEGSRCDGKE